MESIFWSIKGNHEHREAYQEKKKKNIIFLINNKRYINEHEHPRIVALLPMKANSERVKGKNFREFCGKPLFKWILDTLLEVTEIDQLLSIQMREIF